MFVSDRRLSVNAAAAAAQVLANTALLFVLYRVLASSLGSEAFGAWSLVLGTVSVARLSERDAATQAKISVYLAEHAMEVLELSQRLLFSAPDARLLDRQAAFHDGLLRSLGVPLSGDDLQRMNGFEVFEVLYECEEVRSTPAALGEFTGQWPLHRRVGAMAMNLCGMSPMPVHTA